MVSNTMRMQLYETKDRMLAAEKNQAECDALRLRMENSELREQLSAAKQGEYRPRQASYMRLLRPTCTC